MTPPPVADRNTHRTALLLPPTPPLRVPLARNTGTGGLASRLLPSASILARSFKDGRFDLHRNGTQEQINGSK
jgi:hypothetical protein